MTEYLLLFALFILSYVGGILYAFKHISSRILSSCIAFWAGVMLSVSLVHILGESLENNKLSIYFFLFWFLFLYLFEELFTPHKHDHVHGDHSHEDSHEHYNHIALIAWAWISLHTLFDWLGIQWGFSLSQVVGYSVLFGVAIHQIPISLSLAAIFSQSNLSRKIQFTLLGIFALMAPFGFFVSKIFLSFLTESASVFLVAFAWGSLLYIATSDFLPMIHNRWKNNFGLVGFFFLGAILLAVIKFFE